MSVPPFWAAWLAFALAAEPTGFQPERRVKAPTRLDADFASGGARLPGDYDSRRLRYQLFVPPGYQPERPWPLLLVLSPGDDPVGWRGLQKACEDGEFLFAAPYAAGASRPAGQRVRAALDVLDDVRRAYRIDPGRTYAVGTADAGGLACQLAFALPEYFGGVVSGTDASLPVYAHLRHRLADRLSVALVGRARGTALLRDLRVRARQWTGEPWGDVLTWLEQDRERRAKDAATWPDADRARAETVGRLLKQARAALDSPAEQYRAAALLEWLAVRHGKTDEGREARALYDGWRAEPRRGRRLAEVVAADRRPVERAVARAEERRGRLEEARRRWAEVERLTTDPEEKAHARGEFRRLGDALTRLPYLGVTFAGDTNAVATADGPAHAAGLRPGDRVEKVGEAGVRGPEDLRRLMGGVKPGARVVISTRRGGEVRPITVTVGTRAEKSGPPPRE